jgi:hypothetical protein
MAISCMIGIQNYARFLELNSVAASRPCGFLQTVVVNVIVFSRSFILLHSGTLT